MPKQDNFLCSKLFYMINTDLHKCYSTCYTIAVELFNDTFALLLPGAHIKNLIVCTVNKDSINKSLSQWINQSHGIITISLNDSPL